MSTPKTPTKVRQFRRMHLRPALHFAQRRWAVDQDYIMKLQNVERTGTPEQRAEAEKALDFLNRFNGEYYRNSGLDVEPSESSPQLHRTTELRRDCYLRYNASIRDLTSVKGATGWLRSLTPNEDEDESDDNTVVAGLTALHLDLDTIHGMIDLQAAVERGEVTQEQIEDAYHGIESGRAKKRSKKIEKDNKDGSTKAPKRNGYK